MLRTNLATRPFYNDRLVRIGILLAVALVVAFTAFNLVQVMALSAGNTEMSERAQAAERQQAEYARQADAIRKALNTAEMAVVQQAAEEANQLIGRRVFSWTDLFNEFERTLPADVRIAAVTPQVDDDGRMLVAVTVLSRRAEDLNQFMDELESSGRFREVLNRQDTITEEGLTRSILQGYYVAPAPVPAGGAPAASDPTVPATPPAATGNAAPPAPEARR